MPFHSLLNWYVKNHRDLPWRNTKDPYLIWISEVILQQTRVEQGRPFYDRFIEKFPTVEHLAKASTEELYKVWQGLGYYNRANNMHHTAKLVASELKGTFPKDYEGLIKLKGIGPYTAAAIASIAFNEAKAVVDGNVYRVLSRVFAISDPIDTASGKQFFQSLAQEILDRKKPAMFNQAMMELGATLCLPKKPICSSCPIKSKCKALALNQTTAFPIKSKKKKPTEKFYDYLIFINKGKTYIYRRDQKHIWKNLYEPPYLEHEKRLNSSDLLKTLTKGLVIPQSKSKVKITHAFETKHQLTHLTIYASFWIIQNASPNLPQFPLISVALDDVHEYPIHRLFDKFLNYHNLQST